MVINIHRLFLLVLFFIVLQAGSILPESKPLEKFERANKLYMAKDFSGAITLYVEIINEGYESAEVFYNIGNAYFRIGKLGYSILYYEKALKLAPKDEDIKHNLALANIRTVDRIETLPEFFLFEWWEGMLDFFSLKEWTILAVIFYLIVLAAIGFYFFAGSPGRQKAALISGVFSMAIMIMAISLFIVRYNREINEIRGIITVDTAAVKASPEESSGDAFIIHEGLKIKIEDMLNKWVKIRLINGKTGWIKQGEAEVI